MMCRLNVINWLIGVAMYKIKWGKCNAHRMNVSIIKIDEGTSENVQQNIIAMTWGNLCNSRVELIRRCSTWQIPFPWHFLQGQPLLHLPMLMLMLLMIMIIAPNSLPWHFLKYKTIENPSNRDMIMKMAPMIIIMVQVFNRIPGHFCWDKLYNTYQCYCYWYWWWCWCRCSYCRCRWCRCCWYCSGTKLIFLSSQDTFYRDNPSYRREERREGRKVVNWKSELQR